MEILAKIIGYINGSQLEQALELILKHEKELSGSADFWSAKAVLCIKAQEYETAIACLRNVLKLDNTNSDAYYNLAYIYEQLGAASDAAVYYGLAEKYTSDPELKGELESLYSGSQMLFDIKDTAANTMCRTFIILSTCAWGSILQRMHHISRALAKLGQEVVYVSPPEDVEVDSEDIRYDAVVDTIMEGKLELEGIAVYRPITLSFSGKMLYNSYIALIQRLINTVEAGREIVLVAYTPYHAELLKSLEGNFKVIYECVDDHSDPDYSYWNKSKDVLWEQELMDMADAIITTSTALYLQRVSIEGRKNVYLSRNAVNDSDFIYEAAPIPDELLHIPEPRIVYSGIISDWFDTELFYEVVKSNPDKSFIIIGYDKGGIMKEKLPNLYLLGTKKHSELNNYLRNMQVGIIPFKDKSDIIINCDPIKQYEYIACGLPVVTTYMPESAIDKPYTVCANTKDEFNKAIDACIKTRTDIEAVNMFMAQNSWNGRAALLCRIMDGRAEKYEVSRIVPLLEARLLELAQALGHPNFLVLYSLTQRIKDSVNMLEYLGSAYRQSSVRYIERHYLYALLVNKRYEELTELATESCNIEPFVAAELIYRRGIKDITSMEALAYLNVRDFRRASELFAQVSQHDEGHLLSGYRHFLAGEDDKLFKCLKLISSSKRFDSPLYLYLLAHLLRVSGNESEYNECRSKYLVLEIKHLGEQKSQLQVVHAPSISLRRDPYISVIIPTRNSAKVLRHALQTCIEQNYENYEIIVSDNSSPGNEETRQLIDELNCKRIKYYRTPEELPMKENYNYAYDKASGEYMTILGSDDGLLLHYMDLLPNIINDLNRPMSISWDPVAYGWPDVGINSMRNGLFIPYPTQKNNTQCQYYDESVLKNVLSFKTRYNALPMFYYSSIIKRELAEEAKKQAGALFYSTPPDVYSGIVFAYLQKKFIHLNMPMSIGGSSGKSLGITGANPIYGSESKNDEPSFELRMLRSMNMDYPTFHAPYFAGEEGSVVIAATMAKRIFFPGREDLDIDRKSFYETCIKYIFDDDHFEVKKQELYNCIVKYGDRSLIRWYEDKYFNNESFKGFKNSQDRPLTPAYRENGGLVIDSSRFGVADVFGAAQLHRNIVGY